MNTGAEGLIGRVIDLQVRRNGRTEELRGVTLADAGGVGVLVQAGGRALFLPWQYVACLAAAAGGGEVEAPDLAPLRELWGDE